MVLGGSHLIELWQKLIKMMVKLFELLHGFLFFCQRVGELIKSPYRSLESLLIFSVNISVSNEVGKCSIICTLLSIFYHCNYYKNMIGDSAACELGLKSQTVDKTR
jgi:hypothetical protein